MCKACAAGRTHGLYTEGHPDVLENAKKILDRRMTMELKRQVQTIMEGDTLQRYTRRLTMHILNDRSCLDLTPPTALQQHDCSCARLPLCDVACTSPLHTGEAGTVLHPHAAMRAFTTAFV